VQNVKQKSNTHCGKKYDIFFSFVSENGTKMETCKIFRYPNNDVDHNFEK